MSPEEHGPSFADEVAALVRARLAGEVAGAFLVQAPALPVRVPWTRPWLPEAGAGIGVEAEGGGLRALCTLAPARRARVIDAAGAEAAELLPVGPVRAALGLGAPQAPVLAPGLRHLGLVLEKHLGRALRRGVGAGPGPEDTDRSGVPGATLAQHLRADLLAAALCGRFRFEGAWLADALGAPLGPLLARRLARRRPDPLARDAARGVLVAALGFVLRGGP